MSYQLNLLPPEAAWTPPTSFRSLERERYIALDLETRDPHLKTAGPGFTTMDGEIIGIALAGGSWKEYYPIKHYGGGNLDPQMTLRWLKDQLQTFTGSLLMANAQYDLGWLHATGIVPTCNIIDVQIIEAVLHHDRLSYSLDAISKSYFGKGKDEKLLKSAAKSFGVDPKGEMWKLHAKYVGPYAEEDARLTYDIYFEQFSLVAKEGVEDILRLEMNVLPLLLKMAFNGIRVDLQAAEILYDEWGVIEDDLLRQIGIHQKDLWTNGFLLEKFQRKGLEYPRTEPTTTKPNGQPSFTKDFIRNHPDPDIQLIGRAREVSRLRKVYIHDRILNGHIKGRVYPHYIQLASDDGGTRTGRLAGKNHPIQQVPKRSGNFDAKRIRALYLPEEGEQWLGADYDSQEPRLQIHYGLALNLRGAEDAADYVREGKKLYHLLQNAAGCSYDQAKALYLGLSYGMGIPKLADSLGVSEEVAKRDILTPIMNKCPFMKQFSEAAEARARNHGSVRTILGRKYSFDNWQSNNHFDYARQLSQRKERDGLFYWLQKASSPFPSREDAERFFAGKPDTIQRAFTNKAGNAIIQGSAADVTKAAMVQIYEATGVIPLSQVHDEINCSVSNEEVADEIVEIMDNAVPHLLCPMKTDAELGDHW